MNQDTYDIISLKDTSFTKNNVYTIVDKITRKAAIIDPACDMRQITDMISRTGIVLEQVLITHSHPDHIRRIGDLVYHYGCSVYISRTEADYYCFNCPNMMLFDDEEILAVGNTKITCLITPGHTIGSACFLLEDSLFTGDTVFIEGCGICIGAGASVVSMYQSFQKIKARVENDVKIYPAHTYNILPGQTFKSVKQNNVYFCLEEEQFVAFRMRKNQKNLFSFS